MSENLDNRKVIKKAKRIIIKVGSRVLVDKNGKPNLQRIKKIVNEISSINKKNIQIALVSSGAIGSGLEALKFTTRPTKIADLQMAAAVGQLRLISIYDELFSINKFLLQRINVRALPSIRGA